MLLENFLTITSPPILLRVLLVRSIAFLAWALFVRSFKMDNSTKRLLEVVIDDLDEVLSQAVGKHEREEAFSNDGLDEILL